ncbi:MAG TPA: DUF502 domain-containing protein [Candidatus Polarisedimenticolaceae bacterium]
MIGDAWAHVRHNLLRGILVLLPAIITLWLLRLLFGLISDNVTPTVVAVLRAAGVQGLDGWYLRVAVPLIGIVLTFLLVYLFGLIAANLVGKRLLEMAEQAILRIPLVKSIYGGSRQLLDAFNVGGAGGFSRVVVAEYPRLGVWTVGFVTNETPTSLAGCGVDAEREMIFVFFPTTPNPTSGWLALIPGSSVHDLGITVEEGIKLIVSGGIVAPPNLAARVGVRVPGKP